MTAETLTYTEAHELSCRWAWSVGVAWEPVVCFECELVGHVDSALPRNGKNALPFVTD